MTLRLHCPFCGADFEASPPPLATVAACPTCSEAVPLTSTATAVASNSNPTAPESKQFAIWPWSLVLTALIAIAFAAWWFWPKAAKPIPSDSPNSSGKTSIPATLPPAMHPSWKYVPKDAQIVASIQFSPLLQYAERTGQSIDGLPEYLGLPKATFEDWKEASLDPAKLASVMLHANVEQLPPRLGLVIAFREPPKDRDRLRQKLKAKVKDPAKRDEWDVQLPGVPLYTFAMKPADARTFVLSSRESDLDLATRPHVGLGDMPVSLKESVSRLSPSSFVWVATVSTEWSKLKSLEVAAGAVGSGERLKKAEGLRSFAAAFSLEPDLALNASILADSPDRAGAWRNGIRTAIADLDGTLNDAKEWTDLTLPAEPPAERWPRLKSLFE